MEYVMLLLVQILLHFFGDIKLLSLSLLVFTIPTTENTLSSNCMLNSIYKGRYFKDGDFLLGAIMLLQETSTSPAAPRKFTEDQQLKDVEMYPINVYLPYYRHYLALIYAIEEINANKFLLPNITLGYNVYESFGNERVTQENTLRVLTGAEELVPNYSCSGRSILAGFIGGRKSETSKTMSGLTSLYGYTQVSYGAMDPIFNDRLKYPFLFRMVPNERAQNDAIINMLKHFGWTWVGILASEDETSVLGSQELKDQIFKSGACVAYLRILRKYNIMDDPRIITHQLQDTTVNVVILYISSQIYNPLMLLIPQKKYKAIVWIMACTWPYSSQIEGSQLVLVENGYLALTIRKGSIPGLKAFLYSANPHKYPNDYRFMNTWTLLFLCNFDNDAVLAELGYAPCTGRETLQKLPSFFYDVHNFRITYSVYTAVYALAHALHAMLSDQAQTIYNINSQRIEYKQWQLRRHLQNIKFSVSSDEIFFDASGSRAAQYDIENLILYKKRTMTKKIVGNFTVSTSGKHSFFINRSKIWWNHMYTKLPRSVCSDKCEPGYRKSSKKTDPSCCYECVPCPSGEISNTTDMESCFPCPEDQWPNSGRDKCIPRIIEFLSYDDTLATALVSAAVVMTVITASVMGTFIFHQDTPVVRANNRELSYILLICLMLSFLCILLFIGRPVKVTCYLRQAGFGIIFTVAVSSVLAKTFTVVIAFKATKPGSKLRRWFGSTVSICLVCICSLGQLVICVVWLVHSPPYPAYDIKSVPGKMILQCNDGIAFYIMIGYMGSLAALTFLVAFQVRKLPETYNEAQMITFSMLVFCSVWISFVPAYLSTKGKYTVAMEIFAMLASSAGLLGCIFFPKCYIILIRPELNTRVDLQRKPMACTRLKHSKCKQ